MSTHTERSKLRNYLHRPSPSKVFSSSSFAISESVSRPVSYLGIYLISSSRPPELCATELFNNLQPSFASDMGLYGCVLKLLYEATGISFWSGFGGTGILYRRISTMLWIKKQLMCHDMALSAHKRRICSARFWTSIVLTLVPRNQHLYCRNLTVISSKACWGRRTSRLWWGLYGV